MQTYAYVLFRQKKVEQHINIKYYLKIFWKYPKITDWLGKKADRALVYFK